MDIIVNLISYSSRWQIMNEEINKQIKWDRRSTTDTNITHG